MIDFVFNCITFIAYARALNMASVKHKITSVFGSFETGRL